MSQQQKEQHKAEKEYFEEKSKKVHDVELSARYQKAQYETMEYAIKADAVREEYMKVLEKLKAEEEKFQAENIEVPIESEVVNEEV